MCQLNLQLLGRIVGLLSGEIDDPAKDADKNKRNMANVWMDFNGCQ